MATLWMYIHNVESGIHNVDNTIHNVAPPKKEKVQNIASDIMNGDIMNGDIVDAPRISANLYVSQIGIFNSLPQSTNFDKILFI